MEKIQEEDSSSRNTGFLTWSKETVTSNSQTNIENSIPCLDVNVGFITLFVGAINVLMAIFGYGMTY